METGRVSEVTLKVTIELDAVEITEEAEVFAQDELDHLFSILPNGWNVVTYETEVINPPDPDGDQYDFEWDEEGNLVAVEGEK